MLGPLPSRLVFGAEVQYFRLDPRHWETVVKELADTGLACLTTYVQWGTHQVAPPDQQHPAGHFDFTGATDPRLNVIGFLDLVQRAGLQVNFRAGPFCCNEMPWGGQPRWLVNGDPAMMVWDHQNRTTQGYWIARKEGSQPSYLHPAYLDLCRHWIGAIDEIISPRLVSRGGFISMVNLDNEISYICKDSFLDSDYNPINVRPGGYWHQFLTEKYRTVANLPYPGGYTAIDLVPPPRDIPAELGDDVARHLDWVEFKEWVMCRYLGELRQMHVANGVEDVVFMTNFNPHLPEGVPTRMPSFESAVQGSTSASSAKPKGKGIVGYDFYRGSFLSWSGYASLARVLRLMNASVDYTWSAEFMAGIWEKVLTSRISDDHMRFMARAALANGCKAIAWFMFHDRRVWADSPVSSHGHRRPSWEVLRETYALATSAIPHWDDLVVQGDCAVIYDIVAHRHTAIGDPSPCDDGKLHVGVPLMQGIPAGVASREYLGMHRVIEASGHQPLVLDLAAKPELLAAQQLVFMPGTPVTAATTSTMLAAWVEAGGTLVISGTWPTHDERGQSLAFCGCAQAPAAGNCRLGRGRILHTRLLGQEESEHENLAAIAQVRELIQAARTWHVACEPVTVPTWETWGEGSGVTNAGGRTGGSAMDRVVTVEQPRVHASAILQLGGGFPVLGVLNHYPEACELRLHFRTLRPLALRNLVSNQRIPVHDGIVVVDIDRKSGELYAVELA